MSGFKLLAIRPLKDCATRFIKNLNEGEIYKFYQEYQFLDENEEEILFNSQNRYAEVSIIKPPENELDLYSNDKININISAVVGKNGSGKSALSELFLLMLFVISNNNNFVKKDLFLGANDPNKEEEEKRRYEIDLKEIEVGLKAQFYFLIEKKVVEITILNNEVNYKETTVDSNFFNLNNVAEKPFVHTKYVRESEKEVVSLFFYSMLVNYSLYSFNSNELGMWIKTFFHKNDAYQMPVVINPYRIEGNIDINNETYLTRSRMLANILCVDGFTNIYEKSSIEDITLYFDAKKDYRTFVNSEGNEQKLFSDEYILKYRNKFLNPLYEMFFNLEYPSINTTLLELAEVYLIRKINITLNRYPQFGHSSNLFEEELLDNLNTADNLVRLIYEDRSHITLKIRQTLNFIREDIFGLGNLDDFSVSVNFLAVREAIKNISEKEWFTEYQDYVPPSFLISKIRFQNGSYFKDLSSGEKQLIYFFNTVVYHIKNLDSVHKRASKKEDEETSENLIKYDSVNLILDEIELYYHPEFQRKTINQLLSIIEMAKFEYIKNINILFLTHSPFILSDIPKNNVLKLIGKEDQEHDSNTSLQKTFGANIHELLGDNFFLKEGYVGEFAKQYILILIEEIRAKEEIENQIEYNKYKERISVIDEPFIKYKLIEMLENKYKDLKKNKLNTLIETKEKELEELKRKRDDKNRA